MILNEEGGHGSCCSHYSGRSAVSSGTPYMLMLLVGTGIHLPFGMRGQTVRNIGYAFKLLMQGRKKASRRRRVSLPPFQALVTALSATIGTGNIAGEATAIYLGGPGPSSGCGSLPSSGWPRNTARLFSRSATGRSCPTAPTWAAPCTPSRKAWARTKSGSASACPFRSGSRPWHREHGAVQLLGPGC